MNNKIGKIKEIQKYMVIFFLILNCGSTFGLVKGKVIPFLLLLSIISCFFTFKLREKKIIKSSLFLLIILIISFRNIFMKNEIVFLANLIIVYLGVNCIEVENFFEKFSKIIYYISIISFLAYIIGILNPNLIKVVPDYNFRTIYFLTNIYQSDLISYIPRTSGIFWEPGLYQMFLNISLIYFIEKNSYIKVFFIISQIILTISFTGYIALFIIIIYKYFLKKRVLSKDNICIFFITIVLFFVNIGRFYDMYIQKKETYSYKIRVQDTIIPMKLSLEKPFTGFGVNNNNKFLKEFNENNEMKIIFRNIYQERGISNGFVQIFYFKGYIFFLIYMCSLIIFLKKTVNDWKIYFIVVIIGLMNEPVSLSNLFLYIVMSGFVKIFK